ncbi:MAG: DUF1549 domain-containing protein [Kiritimatiellae bacterium]|nr:DUF1549 domain-containing protein [Kiritimatiellia bacterium]
MTTTRRTFIGGAAALAAWPAASAEPCAESAAGASPWETPDGLATDSVMVRRLHLDLAGRIPTKEEAQAYVLGGKPGRRKALVDRLLASDDFADYWAMRFCDVLRVKSEFPINLWPNAVYVYHGRIRRFVKGNESWASFGRSLLTAQGSDFRDAESNFFRATDRRTPEGWAEATAQTFLGIPPAELSPERRSALAEYFANVKIKNTREWKEEIVYVDGTDRRGELCGRLFVDDRAEVSAAFHRLLRGWLLGSGSGTGSGGGAVGGAMRIKDAIRGIVLSKEYARGSVTGGFPVRRLDAEVLDDAFCSLGGTGRSYFSPAPEPFSFLPPSRKTVCIEDGSISSGFLTLFGRPARDTGLQSERGGDVTAKQRLYLFNSGQLARQIDGIVRSAGDKASFRERIEDIYWRVLSRAPTAREADFLDEERRRRGKRGWSEVPRELTWCLVNTKEFLFRV